MRLEGDIRSKMVVAVLVLLVGLPPTAAQGDSKPRETPSVAVRARALTAELRLTMAELVDLSARLDTAVGEEHDLLADRVSRRRERLLEGLPELVDLLLGEGEGGADQAEGVKLASELLDQVLGMIRQRIPYRHDELESLRKRRDEGKPEEFTALDREIRIRDRWFDDGLEAYLKMMALKERLGGDTRGDRSFIAPVLEEHAELRGTQLRIAVRHLEEARIEASAYQALDKAESQAQQAPLKRRIDDLTRSLAGVVDLMTELGMDADQYERLLVQSTGQVTGRALDMSVLFGLVDDWLGSVLDYIRGEGAGLIFKIGLFVLILIVFRVVAGFVRRVIRRALTGPKVRMSQLLRDFILMAAYRGVWLLGFLIAMSQLGIEIGPLLTGVGVAGVIVGFALQNSLSNFASGMMILAYRPFDVGDFIEAAGVSGVAKQLNLVSTTIVTFDNRRLIVPNTKIWEDVIVNVTAERVRRVDLVFGIGYGDDIAKAEKVLGELVEAHPLILSEPEAIVKLHTLGESSVDFVVRPWVETKHYWDVYWDLTRQVKERFDAEGISIPFPQRDVHVFREDVGAEEEAEDAGVSS